MRVVNVGDRLARPHGRLDLAREVIGVMFHPQSRRARELRQVAFGVELLGISDEQDEPQAHRQATVWFEEGGAFKADAKAERYQTQQQKALGQVPRIIAVGTLLQMVWAMAAHHSDQLSGGASLNKAVALYSEFPYLVPMTTTTLWRAWGQYKDVAHFCAAFTSVFDNARREPPEERDERMKRGFHEDLDDTLRLLAAYQDFGTTFFPRAMETALIAPKTAWMLRGIQAAANFLPPPLPAELLAAAERYRAPINSAYR